MPTLQIFTNVKGADIPGDYLDELTQVWQAAIGKPMKYICVNLLPDQLMTFAGTAAPCAFVNAYSIGKLGLEENKVLTKIITEVLAKIGVLPDRMYINFSDVERQNTGWNGKTFAQ